MGYLFFEVVGESIICLLVWSTSLYYQIVIGFNKKWPIVAHFELFETILYHVFTFVRMPNLWSHQLFLSSQVTYDVGVRWRLQFTNAIFNRKESVNHEISYNTGNL